MWVCKAACGLWAWWELMALESIMQAHFAWSWSNWDSVVLELNCLHAVCFACLWTVLISYFWFWECGVGTPSAQVQLHLGSVFQKSGFDASDLRLALEAVRLLCSRTMITEDCLGLWWIYARHSIQVSCCVWHKYSAYRWLRAGYIKMINNKQEKYILWFCYGFFLVLPPAPYLICLYL